MSTDRKALPAWRIAVAVVGLLLTIFAPGGEPQPIPPGPGPAPAPAPSNLDLRGVFADSTRAMQAAALCANLARFVEQDANGQPPRLQTNAQVEEFRVALRYCQLGGGTLGSSFGDRAGAYLESVVGTDGGPVNRAAWATAFRAIESACKREAGL